MVVIDRKMAKLLACLTLVLFLFSLSGCLTKAISGGKDEEVADQQASSDELVELTDLMEQDPALEDAASDPTQSGDEATIGTTDDFTAAASDNTTGTSPDQKIKITLYFADQEGKKLVAETREISNVEGLARATMEELIKGPQSSNLKPTIPAGTKLLDINIKADGLGIVDLSRELQKNHSGGSTAELLTVYSIVNTFAQFDTVDEVQILIGSRKADSLAGHVELTGSLKPDQSLVQQ